MFIAGRTDGARQLTFGSDGGRHVAGETDAVRVARSNEKQVGRVWAQAANHVALFGDRIRRHDPALQSSDTVKVFSTIRI